MSLSPPSHGLDLDSPQFSAAPGGFFQEGGHVHGSSEAVQGSAAGGFFQGGGHSSSEAVKSSSSLAVSSSKQVSSSVTKSSSSVTTGSSYYRERYGRSITLADCSLRLEGTILHATWINFQGVSVSSSLNLDLHIGNVDGSLRWGYKGFSQSCTHYALRPNSTVFIASCRHRAWGGEEGHCDSELDLIKCIHIQGGVLVAIAHADLSGFLSEASWMKFKVVAEPDMNLLFSHPAFRSSVSGVAERAIAHVMEKTQTVIQAVITEALEVIEESARAYVQAEMETIVHTAYLHKAHSDMGKLKIYREHEHFQPHVHKAYHGFGGAIGYGQGGAIGGGSIGGGVSNGSGTGYYRQESSASFGEVGGNVHSHESSSFSSSTGDASGFVHAASLDEGGHVVRHDASGATVQGALERAMADFDITSPEEDVTPKVASV